MKYEYKTNCGQYVLHRDDKPIGPLLDEVSIAFDSASGTMHKHGDPQMVSRWLENTRKKFIDSGFPDMADDLVILTGRFELKDLNAFISTSGYIGRFYQRLQTSIRTVEDQEKKTGIFKKT